MKSALLISFIFFYAQQASGILRSMEDIESYLKANPNTTLKQIISNLDESYLKNYTLVFHSRSPQPASPLEPRIILHSPKSELVLSYTGSGDKLEMFEFNHDKKQFSFALATINGEKNDWEESPAKCLQCHGDEQKSFRPIFDTYPDWPGMYGMSHNGELYNRQDGTSALLLHQEEEKAFNHFRIKQKNHPLYSQLLNLQTIDLETLSQINSRFNDYLVKANYLRVIDLMAKSIPLEFQESVFSYISNGNKKGLPQEFITQLENKNYSSNDDIEKMIRSYYASKGKRFSHSLNLLQRSYASTNQAINRVTYPIIRNLSERTTESIVAFELDPEKKYLAQLERLKSVTTFFNLHFESTYLFEKEKFSYVGPYSGPDDLFKLFCKKLNYDLKISKKLSSILPALQYTIDEYNEILFKAELEFQFKLNENIYIKKWLESYFIKMIEKNPSLLSILESAILGNPINTELAKEEKILLRSLSIFQKDYSFLSVLFPNITNIEDFEQRLTNFFCQSNFKKY